MEYILLGKIVNTFGIRGELKVQYTTDFVEERFKKGSIVYVGDDKLAFEVKSHKLHKGFLLVLFKDNEDINLVEKYKNMFIYKAKEDVKPLKKGEYYFSDLMDLNVYVDDVLIGKIINVEEGISSNYIRILHGQKESLVPFLPVFVKKVDLDNKRIDINNIEGLL